MPDFFLNGGDDFKAVRKWYTPKDVIKGRDIREQTKDYALKIGIDKVKIFPDLAWLLPKKYVKENSQFLLQVPNSNEEPIKIAQNYI